MRLHIATLGALLALTIPAAWLLQQDEEPEDQGWPRRIDTERGTVVIYQPQVDDFTSNNLTARSAISLAPSDGDPVFGAVWFDARAETNRDDRTVDISDISVPNVRFPGLSEEQQDTLSRFLEREMSGWGMAISLDRLLASLELVEERRAAAENLNNDPPLIMVMDTAAILVTIDGEPRMQQVEDSEVMRVINTPFTVLFSPGARTYYLFADSTTWYTADSVDGAWQLTRDVPQEVAALTPRPDPEEEAAEEADSAATEEPGPPPVIVVSTEPAELIVIQGQPEYTPVDGTGLLYVANSESDILLEIDTQRHFVLLSGRWFASGSLFDGSWTFVPGDELPEDFARIPEESDIGHLLVWVPGTELADEAVLEHQIPQTSAILRSEAKLEVTYDGDPTFEPIEDTDLEYAVNTGSQVIKVGDEYYACDQAVWFVAGSPTGPWVVADTVPEEIYTIPPTNPNYNVTYVYVYDSTPEVVYVGYYPGYVGSYVYEGVIVYGTGWYYPSWYATYYYPRPATWGFHVRWNPWWGWSFGFSYGWGPFRFHVGFGAPRGWWGPVGWRGYRRGYYRGWHHGYRAGVRAGARAGYRTGQRDAYRRNNIYRDQRNQDRNAPRAEAQDRRRPDVDRSRENNIYTDRAGNVHRRNDDGTWQQREGDGWGERRESPPDRGGGQTRDRAAPEGRAQPEARDRPSGERQQPSTRDRSSGSMNRDYEARQRGTDRSRSYQSQSRSGGRARSGGGRGRR